MSTSPSLPIITAPHTTLRQEAKPIDAWTEELQNFTQSLTTTLRQKDNPPGVGLASPQVNHSLRMFCTFLTPEGIRPNKDNPPQMRVFVNPEIISTSPNKTLGEDPQEPILEGCLSIPFFYGPVPRWQSIEFQFDEVQDGKLIKKTEKFSEFAARVMQHEYDHLNGVLFTDYILEFDLPLYEEKDEKLKKVKNSIAKKF